MSAPRWVSGDEVRDKVSVDQARELILDALRNGLDPAQDPPRSGPTAGNGQLLIMPSSSVTGVGVKVLSVAPDNPSIGRPRIQAWYVLMDAETLTPTVLLDGTALTERRTPATSAVAMDVLAPAQVDEVVIVGSGPQARGHAQALLGIRSPHQITVIDLDQGRAEACAKDIAAMGVSCEATTSGQAEQAVRRAQVVMCVTSSKDPVIDGSWVADGACVVAIGSHEPDRRELDAALMGRAQVVVEDIATALREAGDVIMAIGEGHLSESSLRTLRELALGEVTRAEDRPNVFKSVGMSWQDLVVAEGAAS